MYTVPIKCMNVQLHLDIQLSAFHVPLKSAAQCSWHCWSVQRRLFYFRFRLSVLLSVTGIYFCWTVCWIFCFTMCCCQSRMRIGVCMCFSYSSEWTWVMQSNSSKANIMKVLVQNHLLWFTLPIELSKRFKVQRIHTTKCRRCAVKISFVSF